MSLETVYISVGSNIEPQEHIPQGLSLLQEHPDLYDLRVSSFYVSEAIGRPEQPAYRNGVVSFATEHSPETLKEVLRGIEATSGRVRVPDRYAPRTLDLDIILFGDRIAQSDFATIPDPSIRKWSFIYVPLLEIAPEVQIPGLAEPLVHMIPSTENPVLSLDTGLTQIIKKGLHHE